MKTLMISLALCSAVFAQDPTCGTAMSWEPDNTKAALQAAKEGKLLLYLHLSGHFEDPGRT